jgi:dTDP-4-dehydrorhamnose reductase
MTSHLIYGRGNLGLSLLEEFRKRGDQAIAVGRESILHPALGTDWMNLKTADYVWWCAGGNHTNARQDEDSSRLTNIALPLGMLDHVRGETRVAFFSTADCVHPSYPDDPKRRNTELARTIFAKHKGDLEGLLMSRRRPLTTTVRVSTLYGAHRPLDTFPGRLLSTPWPTDPMIFPSNEVIPTSTAWLASVLAQNLDALFDEPVHHIAPWGSVSILQWAKMILGDEHRFIERICWDSKRPRYTALGCTLGDAVDHWSIQWAQHYRCEDYRVIPG